MNRFNTGNNIGSLAEEDFYDNCLSLDQAMNSTEPTWRDRFGVEKPTIDAALKSAGFMPAGFDFVTGGTLQPGDRNKAVYNPAPNGDNNWYRWGGAFPKVVGANTQPEPKNANSWVPVNIKTGVVEREALRRTYQEAGLTLVPGSFEAGGTLNSASDVLLQETSGKAFGWAGAFPKVVAAGSAVTGFVDKNLNSFAYTGLMKDTISANLSVGSVIKTSGFNSVGDGGGGIYLVTAQTPTSVDIGAKSFELIDTFDIRKFGIVDDIELTLDQSARFAKMITYANTHECQDINFHGFHFKNPLVEYITTGRGSRLRGIWFTHQVNVSNIGMMKNPDFIANIEAGLNCIGVDLRRFAINTPLSVNFENCSFDAYVDYTTYTTVGEADGFCCGLVVWQNDNRVSGLGYWNAVKTSFKNIHFKSPSLCYNIMAPNCYSTHQENLTGEYIACYVFADSRYNTGSNIRGMLRDDLVRGRTLVKNLVHFEVESGTYTPKYSYISYRDLYATAKTDGVATNAIKMSPVSSVEIEEVYIDGCSSLFLYGKSKINSKINKIKLNKTNYVMLTDFSEISTLEIYNSYVTHGAFSGCTISKATIYNSKMSPLEAGIPDQTTIDSLTLVSCSMLDINYGIARGPKFSCTEISIYNCTFAGVIMDAPFTKMVASGITILNSAAWGISLRQCQAVDVSINNLKFVKYPYGTLFIYSPVDVANSKFSIKGVSADESQGMGIPTGAIVSGGLVEYPGAVCPTTTPYNLGTASIKFNELFLTNGTINTSDERQKTFIEIADVEKEAAREIAKNIRAFKWNDAIELKGEHDARIHYGVGAQSVVKILEDKGLDAFSYSFICRDELPKMSEDEEAGFVYGVRYSELAMFILAALIS